MCWRRNKRSEKCKQNAAFCQKYSNPTVKSANKIIRIISAHFNERLLHALWWLGELKACSSKWADRSTVCNYVKRAYSCSQLVILDFFLRTVGFNKKIQREIRRSRARGEFPKIKSFNVENRHTHTHTNSLSHTHDEIIIVLGGKILLSHWCQIWWRLLWSPALFDTTNILILSFYLVCFCIYTFKSIINVFNMFIFLS